jgi:hypothetical protein
MTVGLLAKTALFPLHIWLPPAHAARVFLAAGIASQGQSTVGSGSPCQQGSGMWLAVESGLASDPARFGDGRQG